MYSKTLIKLIDSAIFPAVFIIAAKVIGIAILSKYFDASYQIEGMKLVFQDAQSFMVVNSYSSLIMFCAVVAGLVWVAFKAHVLHDTHVKPALSAKMLEMNMVHMIQKTDIIYSEVFVWLSYAWLVTLIMGGYALYGLGYWSVFYIALGVTVFVTAILSIDIEREIHANSKEKIDYNSSDNDVEISVGNKRLLKITELTKEFE